MYVCMCYGILHGYITKMSIIIGLSSTLDDDDDHGDDDEKVKNLTSLEQNSLAIYTLYVMVIIIVPCTCTYQKVSSNPDTELHTQYLCISVYIKRYKEIYNHIQMERDLLL
jgi:Fe2+ transport system protein B